MLLTRKLNEPSDCITNMIDPYVTGGMAVTTLYASLPQKISAAMVHLCQIALKRNRVQGDLLVQAMLLTE